MPKKSRKRSRKGTKTRKQKVYNMIGCSKKHKHNNTCNKKDLGTGCPNCGPNCHCGPNCKCPHPCPGACYLNRKMVKKGGQGCGSSGCPTGGLSYSAMGKFGGQRGGSCAACGQMGGSALPGPNVGSPWGTSVKEWPSMNGISGDRNYLDSYANNIVKDPNLQMSDTSSGYKTFGSMVGGKRRSRRRLQKGGGLMPQDLVNLGRSFAFNFQSAYNTINGYEQPVKPLPYQDQLTRSVNNGKILV